MYCDDIGLYKCSNNQRATFTPFSGGSIVNIGNVGGSPDGKYTTIQGDGGQLICTMSATIPANTNINIHTYGNTGDLYAYAKNSAGSYVQIGAWTLAGNNNYKTYTCSANFACNTIIIVIITPTTIIIVILNIDAVTT
ncbi:MAG: hypothetical protein LBH62_08665 [Nitrososphaerota archaeon]|jgi:hypothetical protein|nr:hypothetical protein [Nitrososphaerota archaeon]